MCKKDSQQCHLALLGPTSVKAARKTLMKLTPGGNPTNLFLPIKGAVFRIRPRDASLIVR